jgi:hypothetical protein
MKKFLQWFAGAAALVFVPLMPAWADDSDSLIRLDHYIAMKSSVPAIAGQMSEIYVREVVLARTALRRNLAPLVLFVHGAGTPSEVAFDVEYLDYSWTVITHPYPPDQAAVRSGTGAARASRMTASAVRPARRPVATIEQRSA